MTSTSYDTSQFNEIIDELPHRHHLKDNIKHFQLFLDQVRQFNPVILDRPEFKENEAILWDVFRICASTSRAVGGCKRKWLRKEKSLLNWLVDSFQLLRGKHASAFTNEDWEFIGSILPRRNGEICKEQWHSSQRHAVTEIPWNIAEDNALFNLVQNHGKTSWSFIAKELCKEINSGVFRTAKQCRERWINYLDPTIKRGPWTTEEEIKMLEKVIEVGRSWAKVAKSLGNRTENAVKNRFNSLLKKKRHDWEKLGKNELKEHIVEVIAMKKAESSCAEEHSENDSNSSNTQGRKPRQVMGKRTGLKRASNVVGPHPHPHTQHLKIPQMNVETTKHMANPMSEVNANNPKDYLNVFPEKKVKFEVPAIKMQPEQQPGNQVIQPFAMKTIDQINNLQMLQDLQICLVNLKTNELFLALSEGQMMTLNGFTTALITLQESKDYNKPNDDFNKLFNNYQNNQPMNTMNPINNMSNMNQTAPTMNNMNNINTHIQSSTIFQGITQSSVLCEELHASVPVQEPLSQQPPQQRPPYLPLNYETTTPSFSNIPNGATLAPTYNNPANSDKTPTMGGQDKGAKAKFENIEESPMHLLYNDRHQGSNTHKSMSLFGDWEKFQSFADVASNLLPSPKEFRNPVYMGGNTTNNLIQDGNNLGGGRRESVWKF